MKDFSNLSLPSLCLRGMHKLDMRKKPRGNEEKYGEIVYAVPEELRCGPCARNSRRLRADGGNQNSARRPACVGGAVYLGYKGFRDGLFFGLRPVIEEAKRQGLFLPIVYNSSGYERVETLRMLAGLVDIYLPDFKYLSPQLGGRYSHAPDYSAVAKEALAEMVRQTGPAVFENGNEDGLLLRGTIVRHLLLPGHTDDAKAVIRYLYGNYGDDIYISILNQFTPLAGLSDYPEINRRVTQAEYDEVVDYAIALGVECGFIQEGETAEESFIPEFDGAGV